MKICTNCIHYKKSALMNYCYRAINRTTNLVNGSERILGILDCEEERYSTYNEDCGRDAKFFKRKK